MKTKIMKVGKLIRNNAIAFSTGLSLFMVITIALGTVGTFPKNLAEDKAEGSGLSFDEWNDAAEVINDASNIMFGQGEIGLYVDRAAQTLEGANLILNATRKYLSFRINPFTVEDESDNIWSLVLQSGGGNVHIGNLDATDYPGDPLVLPEKLVVAGNVLVKNDIHDDTSYQGTLTAEKLRVDASSVSKTVNDIVFLVATKESPIPKEYSALLNKGGKLCLGKTDMTADECEITSPDNGIRLKVFGNIWADTINAGVDLKVLGNINTADDEQYYIPGGHYGHCREIYGECQAGSVLNPASCTPPNPCACESGFLLNPTGVSDTVTFYTCIKASS